MFEDLFLFHVFCPVSTKPHSNCVQVTISKFHLWNMKFGALRQLWTFLKKVYTFRKVQEGTEDIHTEEPEEEKPIPTNNSLEELAARLKALQKNRHTLDLVCDIFADFRVRKLGYMCLSWLLGRRLSRQK